MSLFGPESIHARVLGSDNAVAGALSAGTDSADVEVAVDAVRLEEIRGSRLEGIDCLVVPVNGRSDEEIRQFVERTAEGIALVLVVDSTASLPAEDVLGAASAVLPRAVIEAEPAGVADHLASVVEREHARTGFEEIYDQVQGAVAVHDPDTGEMRHANRQLCDLVGYDRAELLSMRVGEFTADIDGYTHERAMDIVTDVAAEGESVETEWPLTPSDGGVRWVKSELKPITVGGREFVLSVSVDITERRRREREYEQIFDGVTEGIAVQDPETAELLDANETFVDRLGYESVEAVREQGIEGLSVTEDGYTREKAKELCQRVVETGEPETVEWQQVTKDGQRLWIEAKVNPAVIQGEQRVVSMQRDVTERRELEREYEQIFNGVNDIINVYDPETAELVEVNDRMCDLTGYDRETILEHGLNLVSATDEGYSAERASALIDEVMSSGESQELEWCLETADGQRRWLEVSATPARINGEHRLVTISRDVTERRQREHEYEQIFNGVPTPITVNDPETGEMLAVNDALCETLGYDRETILEKGNAGIGVGQEGYTEDRAREIVNRVMASGDPETFEWKLETADGDHRVLEVTGRPATIDGQDRYVSLTRDITEQKRREREYEQIFDGVTDAITVHDPATGDLIDLNETMCELTGYDREELLSEGQELINVPEEGYSSERARRIVREVMEDGGGRTLEWLIERKDGDRRWLEVNATQATLNGERRYLAIMRDVTEQRRTERRLRETLERIDEAIYLTRAADLTTPVLREDDLHAGYEAIWGLPLEEIFERNDDGFFDTLHPDEEGGFREFIADLGADIEAGTVADRYSREYRIRRPDGEMRWVHSDFYPLAWPTGDLRIVIVSRDVTERKERERRIASFDDATDDLATADTPSEATQTAVEAATERLGLPAVGAFLYDNDEGLLRPEILTGPLDDMSGGIEPGDDPLWEAFATGTIVAPDGGKEPDGVAGDQTGAGDELPALDAWRGLALGNHGLLLVGAPEGTLDSETIQSAHVLAATLEAALNHLEGQQRIAAQEEQLRTQTKRAERLDRLTRLTQQVESAITDASGPTEIEHAVCTRLVDSGPYDLGWIGGLDVGADRMTARAIAGAPRQYVDGLELSTTDTDGDVHPALRAWQTDAVQVEESTVGDGPSGQWRQQVLTEGFQSLCSVPLTYDGVTQGVLTVGSESPNAFGSRERDVLEQLGTSIGYALAAIERRRALESDETVELEFTGDGVDLPFARAAREAGCRVDHERTVARPGEGVRLTFNFGGDVPEDISQIAARTLPGNVEAGEGTADRVVTVETEEWFGAPLAEYGAVLRDASATPAETTIIVEVSTQADVRSFVDRMQELAPSLELTAKRQHQRQNRTPAELGSQVGDELTDRQLEVVRTALSAGYFEWPRENDGQDVADRLGITQPTLNKHLRLAEQKTFELLFEAEG
jgi:PAS domain S-box-containing protein